MGCIFTNTIKRDLELYKLKKIQKNLNSIEDVKVKIVKVLNYNKLECFFIKVGSFFENSCDVENLKIIKGIVVLAGIETYFKKYNNYLRKKELIDYITDKTINRYFNFKKKYEIGKNIYSGVIFSECENLNFEIKNKIDKHNIFI